MPCMLKEGKFMYKPQQLVSYMPKQEDFEDARRKLLSDNKKQNKKTVSIDDMLNVIENNLKESGCRLSQSWREVTKKNIEIWQQRMEQK